MITVTFDAPAVTGPALLGQVVARAPTSPPSLDLRLCQATSMWTASINETYQIYLDKSRSQLTDVGLRQATLDSLRQPPGTTNAQHCALLNDVDGDLRRGGGYIPALLGQGDWYRIEMVEAHEDLHIAKYSAIYANAYRELVSELNGMSAATRAELQTRTDRALAAFQSKSRDAVALEINHQPPQPFYDVQLAEAATLFAEIDRQRASLQCGSIQPDTQRLFSEYCATSQFTGCASTIVETRASTAGGQRRGTSVRVWIRNLDGDHPAENTPWGSQITRVIIDRRPGMPPLAATSRQAGRSAQFTQMGRLGLVRDVMDESFCPPNLCPTLPWDLFLSPDMIVVTGGAVHGCPIVAKEPNAGTWVGGNWWTCRSRGWTGWLIVAFETDGIWDAGMLTMPGWVMNAPVAQPSIYTHTQYATIACTGAGGQSCGPR